jgi:hypothetical protein
MLNSLEALQTPPAKDASALKGAQEETAQVQHGPV